MEDTLDIISIDGKIQQAFKEEQRCIPEYKTKIDEIKKILNTEKLDACITKKLRSSIREYEEKINNNHSFNFYIIESLPLIEKYKKLLKTPVKLKFVGGTTDTTTGEKEKIIDDFLQIAKKYIVVTDSGEHKDKRMYCDNCKSKKMILAEGVFYICSDCGYEEEMHTNTLSYKDISRTNILQKYTYERRSHFRDCINQFQGKQNCKIDPQIYIDLEEQFEKHRLLVGEKTDPKEKRFSKIKKEHLMLFLKELQYDKQYENANFIYSTMTGAKCPNISHMEDQLMADFDTLVNLYMKKFKYEKKIDRKSFMSIHYVFFQLLYKNKYPCKKEDFNILKTIDRKAFHDDVFKELFEELGWNHKPFF